MAIVRINLLPHREQRRQARQRQFVSLAVALSVLSLAIILVVHGIFSAQIENQNSRNGLLKTEIAKLDEQIKEIDRLREQIQAVRSSRRCRPIAARRSICSTNWCGSFRTASICVPSSRPARR